MNTHTLLKSLLNQGQDVRDEYLFFHQIYEKHTRSYP